MFEKSLNGIWEKLKQSKALTAYERFKLFMHDLGFTGVGLLLIAVWFLICHIVGGKGSSFLGITNWSYFLVTLTLFAEKSWLAIEKIYKRQWNKLFPKGIVIPLIDKTIK